MRSLFILLCIMVAACVVSATPIDPKRWLINRPSPQDFLRGRRSPQNTKGGAPSIGRIPLTRAQPALRKGEFLCGGRACKLQPGEVPSNCNGLCQ